MKNFFKKLAFVLALALVITTIAPAAKASAATEPAFKYSGKVLYVGGDLTGAYGDTYRFAFTNAKGYKATWKSSNAKVATIDAATGEIQAVAVGTTYIYATLTKKGADAVECKAKLVVKQNTEKVGFGTTKAVKNMAVGDTGKVNVYRQVGDKKVWKQADKTVTTDVVKWTTSNPEVATVSKWGVVTAVASGEATITATATQSEGSTPGASKSYTVTVAAGLTSAKQTSAKTIEVKFAGDLSAVANKENVKVYSLVGTTKVNVIVKEVKFDAVDKTKATITVYTDLVKDTEYVVVYTDSQATFKGADLSKDAVASLKVTTTEAVKNEAKEIEVKAYNADGVEIPASVVASSITLEAPTSVDYFLSPDKKITFFNSGKTATVTAVFHTYKFDSAYNEIVVKAEGVINSVDKATESIKSVDAFTVYNSADPDFSKASSTISLSDQSGTYKVAVKTTNSFDKEVKSTDAAYTTKFKFESSDPTTLIISGTTLYPVKEGSAVVIVYFGNTAIGSYPVTVGSKRVASDVVAAFDKTNLSAGNASDSVKLTVTAKDQFGADVTVAPILKVEFVSGPDNCSKVVPVATGANLNEFVFLGSNYVVEGSYQYKVTVDKQPRFVSFVAKKAGTEVSNYQFSNNGKAVDTALKVGNTNNTDDKAFAMNLSSYNAEGFKIDNITIDQIGATTVAGKVYAEVTDPNNKNAAGFVSIATGSIAVTPITFASGTFTKAPVGTYTVRVFKNVVVDGKVVAQPLTVGSFSISDTQTALVPSINKTASSHVDALSAIQDKDDVVTIKIGETFYNSKVFKVDAVGGGKTYNVAKAYVNVDVKYNNQTGSFVQEVVLNAPITLK